MKTIFILILTVARQSIKMDKMTDDDSQANPTKMLQLLVGVQEEKRQLVISNATSE